jgi:hypothetical protein
MTYKLIGTPRIEAEYSDRYETTMVVDLRREDGVTGDVWIVAGVPESDRGSSDAARTQEGYLTVRVFGDSPDHWCPESFRPLAIPDEPDEEETRELFRTVYGRKADAKDEADGLYSLVCAGVESYADISREVVEACAAAALRVHREAMRERKEGD